MNIFDELKTDVSAIEKRRIDGIEASVTVDVGVRLAMFCAAKTLNDEEINVLFKSFEDVFSTMYEENDKPVVLSTLSNLREAISNFQKL